MSLTSTTIHEPAFRLSGDESAYLAGAWDARGGITIESASNGYSYIRVWIDTLSRNPTLDRIFGEPRELNNYQGRTVWRYRQGRRTFVRRLFTTLLTKIGDDRLDELVAAIDYCASTTMEQRKECFDRLNQARH